MLDDSLNMMTVFESVTERTRDTLFIGYSLGCFVSMQSLSYTDTLGIKCNNILLVNGMCSGTNMVSHFKIFAMLLGVNIKPHLHKSNVPITILHAKDDLTVPISEARELKQECDAIGRSCTVLTCDGNHSRYDIPSRTVAYLKLLR